MKINLHLGEWIELVSSANLQLKWVSIPQESKEKDTLFFEFKS